MHALLPAAPGLNYLRFLGVYLASYTAGLAASVPGGIGVFDAAMLLGLAPYLEAPQILGAVVVFRLYYYIIPLFLSGALFTGNELLLRGRSVVGGGPRLGGLGLSGVSALTSDFAVTAAAAAVGICGALLLSLGAVGARPDISWIDPDFASLADPISEFVPSLFGAALIVLALKLGQRVTLAWGATILALLGGAVFCVLESEPLWISFVLVAAALLVAPLRSGFYRRARVFSGPMRLSTAMTLLCLVLAVIALAAFGPTLRSAGNDSWWHAVLSADLPNSVRASLALAVGIGLTALGRLLRPGRVQAMDWTAEARLRYAGLGGMPPQRADGLVWGEGGRAALPYRRFGSILLALGDPAGAPGDQASAIWRLRDLAVQEGREPAVWGAGPRLLKIYADLGLSALRLGHDGRPLPTDSEPASSTARYLVCKVERHLQALLPHLPPAGEQAAAD
jgi:phosphatidylglycerol lysyltransferase